MKIGSTAGKVRPNGYVEIRVDLVSYQAHRLAWLYMTGEWPVGDIDHINRNPSDNSFKNLRQATRSQNLCNVPALSTSSTGCRGVDFHKASGRYRARIRVDGKRLDLGLFNTIDNARAAYQEAAGKFHGGFSIALGE
ncbi:HNH endonuclease [Pseudomonas veronii]